MWFFFPFGFISVLLQSQAVVVHLFLADFPRAPWQGLHHRGGNRVMERSDRWIFTSLTSASHDLLQVLSRLGGVEVLVFPVTTCCLCSTLRHSAVPKQENFALSLFLTFLPACSQAAFLPPSSTTSQLILPQPYALPRSVTCLISFSYLQTHVLLPLTQLSHCCTKAWSQQKVSLFL